MDSPNQRPDKPPDNANLEPKTLSELDSTDDSTSADLARNQPTNPADASTSAVRRRISALGDFELSEKIGAGSMGSVYRAWQVRKDRPAAVKVLKPHLAEDPLFLQRFVREAEVMARLRHPNIVRCFSMGKQHGRYYIAMELVEGRTLADWIIQLGRLSVNDSLCVAVAVGRALQHAHQNGLIHRDVKPTNILITRDGRIKLADMGLARSVLDEDSEATQAGHGAGTPIYVAPEQARDARDADPRSDLYSLGCMFYQMLTGETPFKGKKSLDVIMAKINGRYTPARELLSELPLELDDILCKLLAAHPDERYQCATDLLTDLEHWDVPAALSFAWVSAEPATMVQEEPILTESDPAADAPEESFRLEKRWYVLAQDGKGEWSTQRLTMRQVVERMSDPDFARTASASLFRGSFRPLDELPEFWEAQRSSPSLEPVPPAPPAAPVPTPPEAPGRRSGLVFAIVAFALALGFLLGYLLTRS